MDIGRIIRSLPLRKLPGLLPISLPVAGAIVAAVGVVGVVGVNIYRTKVIQDVVRRTLNGAQLDDEESSSEPTQGLEDI